MSNAVPTLGRTVHYALSSTDAVSINRRRKDGTAWAENNGTRRDGVVRHTGNTVNEGDVFPLIITRVWPGDSVNGQLILDGNDTFWVTSASEGEGPRTWSWPPRA